MIQLRAPRIAEIDALTSLCTRSKAAWGYDAAFMARCTTELTVTPDDIADGCVQVAQEGNDILGVVQIICAGEEAEIGKLFVEPGKMRCGVGRRLFDWAVREARARGARWLLIDADPHAVAFYRRMGAVDGGEVPSESIPGRMLPRLTLLLDGSQNQAVDQEIP